MKENVREDVVRKIWPVPDSLLNIIKHSIPITFPKLPSTVVEVVESRVVAGDLHYVHEIDQPGHKLTISHRNQSR